MHYSNLVSRLGELEVSSRDRSRQLRNAADASLRTPIRAPILLTMLLAGLFGCSRSLVEYSATETPVRRVTFDCVGGDSLELRFFPVQGVAVLVRQGETFELHPEPVASGFRYGNETVTVRGKGEELQVESRDFDGTLTCAARP